ncbi:unnamed protein product [Echinostoma caproni]|uniref:Uncharacterized protein n=1 Tax=Echinostoma caproni TaxID=27848 RepID=A0A183A5A6_9TREM|nr:unnamed protein product [Echinostoma caproni]
MGSRVVLMDRIDYQRNMQCILNDTNKFLRQKTCDDPKELEWKIASEVQFLLEGHRAGPEDERSSDSPALWPAETSQARCATQKNSIYDELTTAPNGEMAG